MGLLNGTVRARRCWQRCSFFWESGRQTKDVLPESEWPYVEDMFWPFSKRSTQQPMVDSHIGGAITLPDSIADMRCVCCKALMPLFFKIDLHHTRTFRNHSLLVFACVACVHRDRLIPQMLVPLKGAAVS